LNAEISSYICNQALIICGVQACCILKVTRLKDQTLKEMGWVTWVSHSRDDYAQWRFGTFVF